MIDKRLLDIPAGANQPNLPLLDAYAGATRYLYAYSPHGQSSAFGARIWWKHVDGFHRHRAYATGHLPMSLPKSLHERVADLMARGGLARWKAAERIAEESWPETLAEFDQMLRDRDPASDQEEIVDAATFAEVMRIGEFLMAAPCLEHPDVVNGQTTRIVGKLGEGLLLDKISFGGRFDDEHGITEALRRLRQLSASALQDAAPYVLNCQPRHASNPSTLPG